MKVHGRGMETEGEVKENKPENLGSKRVEQDVVRPSPHELGSEIDLDLEEMVEYSWSLSESGKDEEGEGGQTTHSQKQERKR